MELKEFVRETLVQITNGVKEAQVECQKAGGLINPMLSIPKAKRSPDGDLRVGDEYYPATQVEFTVGLTESNTATGKAGIGVFLSQVSFGGESSKGSSSQSVTSVRFSITAVFPYVTRKGVHVDVAGMIGY